MPNDPNILIVEDDPAIAEVIAFALRQAGFETEWVGQGKLALDRLLQHDFQCVVLDVGLPDIGGFEVCRRIRRHSDVPILFLTAHSDEIDRVQGFELGADDYLSKPFSPRELTARVRAILRRLKKSQQPSNPALLPELDLVIGPLVWNALQASIKLDGKTLALTRAEYRLFVHLMQHPKRLFTRDQLLTAIQGEGSPSGDRAVDTHIKSLRAKLDQTQNGFDPIVTHRGLGYSFDLT